MNGRGRGERTRSSTFGTHRHHPDHEENHHGIRNQPRTDHRPPRRGRRRQPSRLGRARGEPQHRDRRVVHQPADRREGRQDRVAPGRHLPGRADRHVRAARGEGPAGLRRGQAADPALVEARRGRRPLLDRDPAGARRAGAVPRPDERQRRGAGVRRPGDAGCRRRGRQRWRTARGIHWTIRRFRSRGRFRFLPTWAGASRVGPFFLLPIRSRDRPGFAPALRRRAAEPGRRRREAKGGRYRASRMH